MATYKEGKLCPIREDSNGNAKPCLGRPCMFWRSASWSDDAAGFCGPASKPDHLKDVILDRLMVIKHKREEA